MAGNMRRSPTMARSVPTFLVGAEEQRASLDHFQRRCLHFSEAFQKSKPLCFSARAYQKTHPDGERLGRKDGDVTVASPMLLGVCDGVSEVGDYGLDPARLPRELLQRCERLATLQLLSEPNSKRAEEAYAGPISLLKEAYSETESLGSTSVLLAVMDNTSLVHGKVHPMIGVVTLGDCEMLLLRRTGGGLGRLQLVLHTEMQRIGGDTQTPLQLARLSESLDPAFDEEEALEAIERGSGLHCTSAREGDVLILGSDGVFDNLFLGEVLEICNSRLLPTEGRQPRALLREVARLIVETAHAKSGQPLWRTPHGAGKADDTSVVVAEVVEWTGRRRRSFQRRSEPAGWEAMFSCNLAEPARCGRLGEGSDSEDGDREEEAASSSEEDDFESSFEGGRAAAGCSIL